MQKDKRSLDYEVFIEEQAEDLLALERRQGKALLRDRVRFLRLLKSGECSSQAQAGKQIGLKRRAAEKLWSKYTKEGLAGLLRYPYQGSKPQLSEAQSRQLEAELRKDGIQTLEQGCTYVKNKTGRPVHVHKDEKGENRFKKKTSPS